MMCTGGASDVGAMRVATRASLCDLLRQWVERRGKEALYPKRRGSDGSEQQLAGGDCSAGAECR